MKDIFGKILAGAIIAIVAAMVGFGISQAGVGADVSRELNGINNKLNAMDTAIIRNAKDIEYSHERDLHQDSEMENERKRTDSRVFSVASLMEQVVKQNTEFIQLLKVQNELLSKDRK